MVSLPNKSENIYYVCSYIFNNNLTFLSINPQTKNNRPYHPTNLSQLGFYGHRLTRVSSFYLVFCRKLLCVSNGVSSCACGLYPRPIFLWLLLLIFSCCWFITFNPTNLIFDGCVWVIFYSSVASAIRRRRASNTIFTDIQQDVDVVDDHLNSVSFYLFVITFRERLVSSSRKLYVAN